MNALDGIRGGLIVSSQSMDARSPLTDPHLLAVLARAAELGGPAGFRVDGAAVIRELRASTALPIIGIRKRRDPSFDTYITTSIADAMELIAAGADIVAAQATRGSRPSESFAEIVEAVHEAGGLMMADIATLAEAADAAAAGADIVATTLVGYTAESEGVMRPATRLVEDICAAIDVPVVLEGGVWTPDHVKAGFDAGATAVVAGSAITAPDLITRRLAAATPRAERDRDTRSAPVA